MSELQCFLILCLCYFAVGSYGSDNLVPFIDKCEWNDKACLKASTEKAVPYFAKGLPELGIEPMDPLKVNAVTLSEGDLKVQLTDMKATGTSKSKILNVERDISKNLLVIEVECPIEVIGNYEASGKLLGVPIEGNGPFQVKTDLVYMKVEVDVVPVIGADGVKYWSIKNPTHTYDPKEKTTFNFENLFNGDQEKAGPILAIFNENWRELILSFGKPIVDAGIDEIVRVLQHFCSKVPADQLEK